ncbi:unnamed protein product [Thlaspi arvense]|uniref:Uncharacterized protein n=1 Tax=Thlaspi arvense TaxID=13288 RepID=A0AAU9RA19_THLAR|nr:unnamed protein product [Thlaspi arvense]
MGGIVAFQWEQQQLTVLQNRDNWEARQVISYDFIRHFGLLNFACINACCITLVIKAAAWDEDNKILAGRCEVNGGTWFGVSRNGRVAFLADSALLFDGHDVTDVSGGGAEWLPVQFVESKMSPKKFAEELQRIEKNSCMNGDDEEDDYEMDPDERGLTYNLIVADITSSSMYYICKPMAFKPRVDIEKVAFGVHTLSSDGLDNPESPKDLRLKGLFNGIIVAYKNKQLPPLKELAERLMYDRVQAVQGDQLSALFVEKMDFQPLTEDDEKKRYGTTSTTAFAVKPTKEVVFYERHFEPGGGWTHHDFTFNITA